MSEQTKPHTFGGARHMTAEEKEAMDNAFFSSVEKVEHPEIERLKQQLEQAQARVARLRGHLVNVTNQLGGAMTALNHKMKNILRPHLEEANKAIYETPAQATADIEARAVEKAKVTSQMKADCMGEEAFSLEVVCQQCLVENDGNGPIDDCEMCGGEGVHSSNFVVPWDSMKSIWKMMNKSYARELRKQAGSGDYE